MTNQILMAAARGARTQAQFHNWANGGQDWRECPPDTATRIHPDDEALRFGPISTALREFAESFDVEEILLPYISIKSIRFGPEDRVLLRTSTELHRSLFLLILSEVLAEEGL